MRLVLALPMLAALTLAGCGSSSSGSGSSSSSSSGSTSGSATSPGGLNHVHSIVIMPNNPNVLYLGAHYRLYNSNDGGKTWHPLIAQMMLSMAMDPARPAVIYAVSSQRGPQKTTDGGAHWQVMAGLPSGKITGVAFDPANQTLFAYGVGMYRSADGGAHWSKVLSSASVANVAAGGKGTLYAATGNGLEVSHDGGSHWTSVKVIGNQPVIQVAAAGTVAYAVTPVALFKSADAGHSWKTLGQAPQGIEFLGVSPSNPNEVIGEVGGQGFEASHDGGRTWRSANSGIHDRDFNASTVRIAPSTPKVAYTGAWGLHFYATHDGGHHWVQTATLKH